MKDMLNHWKQARCRPAEGPPLSEDDALEKLSHLEDWTLEGNTILRSFVFENYYQTVSFINAVAWIAHRQDHHPEVTFSFKHCLIRFSTDSVGGLSENDFICAAQIDDLTRAGEG